MERNKIKVLISLGAVHKLGRPCSDLNILKLVLWFSGDVPFRTDSSIRSLWFLQQLQQ
uniref:Uncharacterized protein n=1 Tax=Anguilla anguilla TaxID=7936 RepID=A0A0E9SN13_ANGAN